MNTCATCKHWGDEVEAPVGFPAINKCEKLPIWTEPEFGCQLHEETPRETS